MKYVLPHKDQVREAVVLLHAGPSIPLHYSLSKKRDEKRPSSFCPNTEGKGKVLLFSHEVMFDSLWPHGLQHTRLPCPSLYLLEFAQTHVHWVTDAIQPSHPLSLPSPLALNLSQHQVFSSELAPHVKCPNYWSFSLSPSNECSGLISFRIDWFDLAVQGTLKSPLQYCN